MKRLYLDEFKPLSGLESPSTPETPPPCPVIDSHAHFGPLLLGTDYEEKYDTRRSVETLRSLGLERILSLELVFDKELDRLKRKLEASDGFILPAGSVDISQAGTSGFESLAFRQVRDLKKAGCPAVKLWKNMTLASKEMFGEWARLDDGRYDAVYKACGEEGLPIIIHIADPPCFFRPNDPSNEYYLCLYMHPEWSFHKEGIPSFEAHMEMQERIIADNPGTTFVVAHAGSYAENLAKVGTWLDTYPNMYIDVAARLDQLGRQPYTSRAFLDKYQDRVIFGTDYEARFDAAHTEWFYKTHYRFFQTCDEYFDHPFHDFLGQWKIFGVGLGKEVLRKIYRENAKKVFRL
jgi:predicted TIM-barrel fold metal-dependent hydrolase